MALYTDKHSTFKVNRPPDLNEQLAGEPAQTQFARALKELGIEWIAAHSPRPRDGSNEFSKPYRIGWSRRCGWPASARPTSFSRISSYLSGTNGSPSPLSVREMLTGHFAELTTLRRFLVSATHAPSRTTTPFTGTASDGLSHEHRSKPACAELVSTWRDG